MVGDNAAFNGLAGGATPKKQPGTDRGLQNPQTLLGVSPNSGPICGPMLVPSTQAPRLPVPGQNTTISTEGLSARR